MRGWRREQAGWNRREFLKAGVGVWTGVDGESWLNWDRVGVLGAATAVFRVKRGVGSSLYGCIALNINSLRSKLGAIWRVFVQYLRAMIAVLVEMYSGMVAPLAA